MAPPTTAPAASRHQPVALTRQQAASLATPHGRLYLGGIWGEVAPGQTWLATDGERLVLSASTVAVIFLLKPRDVRGAPAIYLQSAEGFRGEVTTYPLIEGARRAAPMVRLVELELQVIMGIVSATSGVGFAAVVGTDVLRFVTENRANFDKWGRMLAAAIAARETLRRCAPLLYEKIVEAALLVLIADVVPRTPGALSADTVCRMVGALLGKLGKQALESRLSAVSVGWVILKELVTRVVTTLPKAAAAAGADYRQSADQLISHLRSLGVTVTPADMVQIVDEIRRHPKEIAEALRQLVEASR